MAEGIEQLKEKVSLLFQDWHKCYGFATDETAIRLDNDVLLHVESLVEALSPYIDPGLQSTYVDNVICAVIIGAIAEAFLTFFYIVYHEDYKDTEDPVKKKFANKEPEEQIFDNLIRFSTGILWDENSSMHTTIDRIRQRRNAIHLYSPKYRLEVKPSIEDDVLFLNQLADIIIDRLPCPSDFND